MAVNSCLKHEHFHFAAGNQTLSAVLHNHKIPLTFQQCMMYLEYENMSLSIDKLVSLVQAVETY